MPSVEDRLTALEQRLTLGIGGRQGELDAIRASLGRLTSERTSGNVFGGMIRTDIGPGFSYIGPYERDVDATHHLTFNLPIPIFILRISELRFFGVCKPIRTSVAVTAADTLTPANTIYTSQISDKTTTDAGGDISESTQPAGSGLSTVAGQFHTHVETGVETNGPTSTLSVAGSGHTHDFEVDDHSHGMNHDHRLDPHTHPAHNHTLTQEITESVQVATDIELWIDGVDRTAALGGPWDESFDVDVRPYLVNNRQIPQHGTHEFEFRSATIGALEVTGYIYTVVKPPL